MSDTTLVVKRPAMHHGPLPNCHDGVGALDWTEVLAPGQLQGRHLRFVHDDVLAPGVTIGVHAHDVEEYYYILSGRGTMILDDEEIAVGPGDIAAVYPGGSHGLANDGGEDLRVLVIGLR